MKNFKHISDSDLSAINGGFDWSDLVNRVTQLVEDISIHKWPSWGDRSTDK